MIVVSFSAWLPGSEASKSCGSASAKSCGKLGCLPKIAGLANIGLPAREIARTGTAAATLQLRAAPEIVSRLLGTAKVSEWCCSKACASNTQAVSAAASPNPSDSPSAPGIRMASPVRCPTLSSTTAAAGTGLSME
jgi:hypothetical protein